MATPVQYLPGVGPERARLLENLDVRTVEDLLYLVPRGYQDLRQTIPLGSLQEGQLQAVVGKLNFLDARVTRGGKPLVEACLVDDTGLLHLNWFNRPAIHCRLKLDHCYRLTGKVQRQGTRWQMTNPKVEAVGMAGEGETPETFGPGVLPVYPLTDGLHLEIVRTAVREALERFAARVPELLPPAYRQRLHLATIEQTLWGLHFPKDRDHYLQARHRLIFDEFLTLQTALALRRRGLQRRAGYRIPVSAEVDARIRRLFPFTLTPAQDQTLAELVADIGSGLPMYRLLQGDVGAGKTVIALYLMLAAIAGGLQTVLIAPTEVLARQHFRAIEQFLAHSRVRRALLTGGTRPSERVELLAGLKAGTIHLVVGTHALLEPEIDFARLGVVVIDEQHKFGVRQRAVFQKRHPVPHHLVMTATPIPRSLGMTWFGDLDVSILQGKPPGRQETRTWVVPPEKRQHAYEFVEKTTALGTQAIIVCPRIAGEDEEGLQSVENLLTQLRGAGFAVGSVDMVHGKLSDADKEGVLARFRQGALRVLISTVVVEVGLDIPNANLLMIENAERFGLSQLHQLRGRVGRGTERGVCLLMDGSHDPAVNQRLQTFANTNDGFRIAELDARLRGIGETIGERQHGFVRQGLGHYVRDVRLLLLTRKEARALVEADPMLADPQWGGLRHEVLRQFGQVLDLALIG